jgi:hypothetical protein
MNTALTMYTLDRVLFHLGEEQQVKNISLADYADNFPARAEARVIVKRLLRSITVDAAVAWELAKANDNH